MCHCTIITMYNFVKTHLIGKQLSVSKSFWTGIFTSYRALYNVAYIPTQDGHYILCTYQGQRELTIRLQWPLLPKFSAPARCEKFCNCAMMCGSIPGGKSQKSPSAILQICNIFSINIDFIEQLRHYKLRPCPSFPISRVQVHMGEPQLGVKLNNGIFAVKITFKIY